MMLFQYVYFVVLTAVVVLSLASLFVNFNFYQRSSFDKVMVGFLVFLIFHSLYACVARFFFVHIPFVDVGAPFGLFYGPFFYLSLVALKKEVGIKWKQLFSHFFLALIFVVSYVVLWVNWSYLKDYSSIYLIVLYMLSGIQLIAYALFGFVKFNESVVAIESKLVTNYAMKIMVLVALIFLGLSFDHGLSDQKTYVSGVLIYLFMLMLAVIVFRYHILILISSSSVVDKVAVTITNTDKNRESLVKKLPNKKYEKSQITEEEGLVYLNRLNKAMQEDKLYLNPELTIDSLSKTLKMTKHHLTQVFTIVLDSNFNKHINHYRIIHASSLLKKGVDVASIGDIGTESGFNSRTSFFRAFKNHYGISPADYRKQQL
ncbi:AraC family transcriptional regulator [Flavobacterium sp. NKUCC04_CG]|uniref:helix-turn-helix domain-containing protein n=1 Tax=Flavobacterium sp. NKUCC04_CG TaxID=2842121 RepID=UPI001C5AAE19|nr:AraC family transcriptional regulator [Flavobacterium sp. NKUCC04_CG]MBW3518359.1 helix-turn-helix domain-containing protein [Flavobacterium sp. NKUCC04_CG]